MSSTMTSGRTRSRISRSCGSGAVDERLPDRTDERLELLDRRLAEFGRRLGDEIGPELAGVLLALRRRSEINEVLFEAQRRKAALPGGLGGEDDAVAAPFEDLADADAVVRRPVGALGHEEDGQALVGHGFDNLRKDDIRRLEQ